MLLTARTVPFPSPAECLAMSEIRCVAKGRIQMESLQISRPGRAAAAEADRMVSGSGAIETAPPAVLLCGANTNAVDFTR